MNLPVAQRPAINAIIVDDEYAACMNLRKTLLEYVRDNINVLAIAQNTFDAGQQISQLNPDVVFLDIEMPSENAFDFLERISPVLFSVVFVTAYDEYAIRAFRLNAVDYILKPIRVDEVAGALAKVRERLTYRQLIENKELADLKANLDTRPKLDRIKLKDTSGFDIVDFKDILYIEAKGSYSCVHYLRDGKTPKSIITSNSLNEYEDLLPDDIFYRIHRSYIVNCNCITKVHAEDNFSVTMINHERLPVSRRRTTDLMARYKNKCR